MEKMKKVSAGILIYRKIGNKIEVLLAHPGGPFWVKEDVGIWSIPKGEVSDGEEVLETSKREFKEETGFITPRNLIELGSVVQKNGKIIYAWAAEGDFDTKKSESNTFKMEWPPKSGKKIDVPEIDRVEYFDVSTAKTKINPAQIELIDRLENILKIDLQ